jgi:transposase
MFIRKTRTVNRQTGKIYFNFQLVESYRTPRGPRQRILLSLGSDLDLIKEECNTLAHRIEEIIYGQQSLFTYPEKIETLAQTFAKQWINAQSTEPIEKPPEEFKSIDINTIEHSEARSIGVEHILLHLVHEIKLPQKLQRMGMTEKEVKLSIASIIARAVAPGSERATLHWLNYNSALGELIDIDFRTISLDSFYKISDQLLNHKPQLESYLETTQREIHGYKNTMILYDLTNTYMEGQAKENPKAKRGRSKEKRSDCPLVTLGLVINEQGFPIRSEFLPGNISEPSTLKQSLQLLSDPNELFHPTIILDAGIATEANLLWLRQQKYTYIVSARQKPPTEELVTEPITIEGSDIKVALVKNQIDEEERWLYCESQAKTTTTNAMRALLQKRFETDLKKIVDGLAKPKGRKQYNKITERMGRLKEKHRHISHCYEIEIVPSADGKTALSISWTARAEKIENKLNGHYFLRTNLLKGPLELWDLYNSIRTIEDIFRFMKTDLGMRPVHHQKGHRVDGHIWITLLAYHLIKSCLYQLQKRGIKGNWKTIRTWMSTRVRVTTTARTAEGEILHYRSTTKPEALHKKIYEALGIGSLAGKIKKFLAKI